MNYAHSRLLSLAPTATNPVVAPNWSYDYGPNSAQPYDILHWNYVWELPFGRGRRFGTGMNRIADAVVGGWLLSGLGTWQSGSPLTVTASGGGQSPTGATTNRADRVGSGSLDTPTPQRWFDTAAYRLPAYIDPSASRPTRQFGTAGIGTVFGPKLFSYDMTAQKSFALTENAAASASELRPTICSITPCWATPISSRPA